MKSSDSNRVYSVDSEIDRGGMGIIYKIRDESLGRDLAMKVIRGQADGADSESIDAELTERFVREAEITRQLNHPGVVPIHEIGTDQESMSKMTFIHSTTPGVRTNQTEPIWLR